MIFPKPGLSNFRKTIMRKSTIRKTGYRFSEAIMLNTDVQQQSGRWAGRDARTTERMDAIRNIKTMAGSPDADLTLRSASRNLAHGLCVSSGRSFVNP
jgi:hypothetical protein